MKTTFKNRFSLGLILASLLFIWASCAKENSQNTAAPVIHGVVTLENRDTPLDQVDYGVWIMIKGANLGTTTKVDFNGTLAADSLIYATDNDITVKIPATLTDPINNPITVTTKYGTVTHQFKIAQPAPLIHGFDPPAGSPSDEVTIKGDYFKGVSEVRFDDTKAEIISSTQTQIKVKLPVGVNAGYIFVTTPIGTVKSTNPFGIRHFIWNDALNTGWTNTSYSATYNMAFKDVVRSGTTAIEHKFTVGFGAARFRSVPTFKTAGYTMLKISIYGGPGTDGKKVKISLTPAKSTFELLLTEGKWTDYVVPLANLGNPTDIDYITFQEFSGLASLIYIDAVGFY
ncbi:MAG: hypothetical protein EOO99_00295 [Pedobacter sp.]|nr:MAG: hypothetical protein EOO99_00295 [Pedobacter sp.]